MRRNLLKRKNRNTRCASWRNGIKTGVSILDLKMYIEERKEKERGKN